MPARDVPSLSSNTIAFRNFSPRTSLGCRGGPQQFRQRLGPWIRIIHARPAILPDEFTGKGTISSLVQVGSRFSGIFLVVHRCLHRAPTPCVLPWLMDPSGNLHPSLNVTYHFGLPRPTPAFEISRQDGAQLLKGALQALHSACIAAQDVRYPVAPMISCSSDAFESRPALRQVRWEAALSPALAPRSIGRPSA